MAAGLAFALLGQSPAAQAAAQPKSHGCFTMVEEVAEQIVREGVRLREGAAACDETPWNMGTRPLWVAVDKQFGPRFAAQTAIRQRAFEREFAGDAGNRLDQWNGRIVMHFRQYPLSALYCRGIKDELQQFQRRGWKYFTNQAAKAKEAVHMDYNPCTR